MTTTWVQMLGEDNRTPFYFGVCSAHGSVTALCETAAAAQAQATIHARRWCKTT